MTGPTIDLVVPTITSFDPTAYATGVGTNAVFHVYFSKRLNPISLQFETIDLVVSLDANRNLPVSLTSIAADRMSATYTPGVSLQPFTTYYFQLATNFSDVAGNLGSGTIGT